MIRASAAPRKDAAEKDREVADDEKVNELMTELVCHIRILSS